jgi:hypothetical protein
MDEIEKRINTLVKKWITECGTVPRRLFVGYAEEMALYESKDFVRRGCYSIKTYHGMKLIRVDEPYFLMVGDAVEEEREEEKNE